MDTGGKEDWLWTLGTMVLVAVVVFAITTMMNGGGSAGFAWSPPPR